ncbi:glycoside hydrolase family 36 protein [Paenibacillus sp. FSL R5-0517]|uniref:glycoside hydrolase family 36 protein n=1 Tax=Paenibacillus sp. FSL R5-0517 TaxID=2921647 RepID=UPI0030DBE104
MKKDTSTLKWRNHSTCVEFSEKGEQMEVRLQSPACEVFYVVLRWEAQWPQQVSILGDHFERGYGDLEWRGHVTDRKLPWYFLVNTGESIDALGVKTRAGAICYWNTDPRGFTLTLDVRNGTKGVQLGDRVLEAATIIYRHGLAEETSFEAACEFCKLLCDDPLQTDEPVYGSNNWYYAYGNSSYSDIIEDSRLLAELSPIGGPRPYMVIDDGWQPIRLSGQSCNGGPWERGNNRFMDMEKLAADMKEIGVKPGIWYRPLLTSERHESHFKRRTSEGDGSTILDPSVPEVLELIKKDIRRFVNWGYMLIKHDFSTFDIFGKWGFEMNDSFFAYREEFKDRSKTTAEIIVNLYKAIRDAAGDAVIIGCNTIGHLAAGLVHVQRTGDDTSGIEWERTRKMGINTLAFRMPQHNALFQVDADCVGITDKIPWELNRQWLQLLSRSGTPLFISADPKIVDSEMKEEIRAAYVTSSKFIPAGYARDWMNTTTPEKWVLQGQEVEFNWHEDAVLEKK